MKRADFLAATGFTEAEVRPLRVGRRLWIGPAGVPLPEADLFPVWLAPGPAFGSGVHPTTQLCLKVLDRHLQPGARVLDLGTGTGILAIAAARLGAQRVLGLDIDPGAVAVAQANVSFNKLDDRVEIAAGTLTDVLRSGAAPYSWVVTNILAHVIATFFDQGLPGLLAPGGWLVLSGFLRSQTPLVRAPVASEGLELLAQEQQGEWICIVAQKPGNP